MRRTLIPLLALGACQILGACQPQTFNSNWQYHAAADLPPLTLAYVPGRVRLPAVEVAQVRALGAVLPQTAMPVLYAAGAQDEARVRALELLLDRPIRLARLDGLGPDTAILASPVPRGILSDACRGPGQRTPGGIWPGDDRTAPVLLPSGCAVESDIAAQVTEPQDLLRGRPLPAGASLPYGAAIERYYDGLSGTSAQGGSGGGGGGGGGTRSTTDPAGEAPANPLLGSLPAAAQ